jgi:hypothetical protein
MKNLEILFIGWCKNFTDDFFEKISFKKLEVLELDLLDSLMGLDWSSTLNHMKNKAKITTRMISTFIKLKSEGWAIDFIKGYYYSLSPATRFLKKKTNKYMCMFCFFQ